MKLLLLIATIFISIGSGFCQNYFEGKVVYKHTMKGFGNSNITEEIYYRKDGSYASEYKEQSMKVLYLADKNTLYTIHKINGKTMIMFDSTFLESIGNTNCVYLVLDSVEERECLRVRSTVKSGKLETNTTSWIDTSINVFNIVSPTKRGLDIKAISFTSHLNMNVQEVKKIVSIKESPVSDTLFELPTDGKIKWIDVAKMKNIKKNDSTTINKLVKELNWVMNEGDDVKTKYIMETSDNTFENDIKTGIIIVDFWAKWCIPCQSLTPKMEIIGKKYADKIKILKVDVDKCPITSKKYDAKFIPLVIILKDGEEIGRLMGADLQNSETVICEKINEIIQ